MDAEYELNEWIKTEFPEIDAQIKYGELEYSNNGELLLPMTINAKLKTGVDIFGNILKEKV